MCFMCGIMQPETLSHFMNECPAYDDIKAKVAMGGVMIDATSIVCRPDETTSCDTIKMLFHMWLRRIDSDMETYSSFAESCSASVVDLCVYLECPSDASAL